MPSITYSSSSSKPSAPESIQILTGTSNYTVPANKVAIVSALCAGSATVSLNGTQVLNGATWNAISSNASPRTVGSLGLDSLGTTLYSGSNVFTTSTGGMPQIVTVDRGATFTNASAQAVITSSYTVPAGTTIATVNGRVVIEIYSA